MSTAPAPAAGSTATSSAPSNDSTATLGGVAPVAARRGRPRGAKDSKPRAIRSDSRFAEKKDADGIKISDPRQPSLFDIGVISERPRSLSSTVPAVAESKDSAPTHPHSAAPLPTADNTTSNKEVSSGLLSMLFLH